ncbi:MAG: phage major capsid protein [Thermodesulfovibrio sp.]|nr:phage major capsid protein [Thermodesulfovibrio sp.]
MATFNYGTPHGIYRTQAQGAQDFLNTLSRGIPNYVVAQNIGKLSPFVRKLLGDATSRPIGFPFVAQPVTAAVTDKVQRLDYSMSFVVPTDIEKDTTDMMTLYANLYLTTLYVTDFEVQAYNSGNPNMLVDHIATRASLTWIDLMNTVSTDLVGSRVSGTEDTTKFYGLRDIIDNGTQNATYGNINRATKTWWNSRVYAATTDLGYSAGTDTPAAYVLIMRGLAKYTKDASTMGTPNIAFTSFGCWQKIAESFVTTEKYIVADTTTINDIREYEVTGLIVNGCAIFPDPYITENVVYFINFNHLRFEFVDGYMVTTTPWYDAAIIGKLAYVSAIKFGGQLVCDAPVSCFKITGFPAVNI